jgi:hypothetical protein
MALLVGTACAAVFWGAAARAPSGSAETSSIACSSSYVAASLSWGDRCLRAGEFCKVGNVEYHRYGFDCPASGHLVNSSGSSSTSAGAPSAGSAISAAAALGRTVLIAPRTRTAGCRRGAEPDRRCSPGAYYSGLTRAVICSPSFHTSTIRDVPQSEKFQVETEYGMPAAYYGYTIEIDHIVPLELGGSNDSANLFPEAGSGRSNYHVKDELENRLHDLVCSGAIPLRTAQQGIATNWQTLYRKVFDTAPG